MLRGILDGHLGMHELPPEVYVVYASNMDDEGVEGVAMNQEFNRIDFDAPGKDEWFTWLIHKFAEDEKISLNMKVINKFHEILDESDLSHNDTDKDVRASPRRWEQLLLLINNALPVKNQTDAGILMQNVHINFRNYQNGKKSVLLEKVSGAVAELIKDTSGIEIAHNTTHPTEHWRDVLESQIKAKMQLGEHRSYIPVLSGLPGVGKTTHVLEVALNLGLVPILINCATLSPEDAIGLPLSDANEKGDITVKFSEPMLQQVIKNAIKRGEANLKELLKKHRLGQKTGMPDAAADWKEFEKADHKYLIFFDELNRTSTKTFNALRRILLDKKFGDGSDLPKGSVIIAAINPIDHGTTQLTSHMRDVLDIIPTGFTWNQTKDYLQNVAIPKLAKTVKNAEIPMAAYKTIEAFMNKFRDPQHFGKKGDDGDESEFHLNVGASNAYVSPREISDLFTTVCYGLDRELTRFKEFADTSDDNRAITEQAARLKDVMFRQFKKKLSFSLENKNGIKSPQFFEDLHEWFLVAPEADHLDLISKKVKTLSITNILEDSFKDQTLHLADNIEFTNYIQNVDPAKFKADLLGFLDERVRKNLTFLREVTHIKRILSANDFRTITVDKSVKVTHIEHFMRDVVHALFIHELSKEFIAPLKWVFREFMSDIVDLPGSKDNEGSDTNQSISFYINSLKKAEDKKNAPA